MDNKDMVMPDGKWEFSEEVTQVFDDMLSRSIPQYAVMRSLCYDLSIVYVKPDTTIIDVGCSRGDAIASLIQTLGSSNRYVGYDISQPMLHAARGRFAELIEYGVVDIQEYDLRGSSALEANSSVALCVLSLMFTPIEYRHKILKRIYDALNPGGALIIVEKVLGNSAEIHDTFTSLYYDFKKSNGYTQEQIDRKRLSLEGVQVCLTSDQNTELLKAAKFSDVTCFWQWLNFAGWLAIK